MHYIIYCHAYNKASGGNVVTYELCKKINNYLGRDDACLIAPTFCRGDGLINIIPDGQTRDIHGRSVVDIEKLPDSYFDESNYNLQGCKLVTREILLRRNNIAIYTEGFLGNPLEQKRTIRWICYFPTPGLPIDPFFPWNKGTQFTFWIYPYYHNRDKTHVKLGTSALRESFYYPNEEDLLFLQLTHLHEDFKDLGLPREGSCYMVRKADPNYMRCAGQLWASENNPHGHPPGRPTPPKFIHPEDAVFIDYTPPEKVLELFNTKKTFYVYDLYSFHAVMAAMCGCDVIVGSYDQLTEEDWRKGDEVLKYGVSYGPNNLDHARKTRHLVKREIEKQIQNIPKQIEAFINRSDCVQTECIVNYPTITKSLVNPPEANYKHNDKEFAVDFWTIKFDFNPSNANKVLLDCNLNTSSGPNFFVENNELQVKVGNYLHDCFDIYSFGSLPEGVLSVKLERQGYHLTGALNGEQKFHVLQINFPLSFNKIFANKNIKNLSLKYY